MTFAVRLVESATERDTPIPEIYQLFESLLTQLRAGTAIGNPIRAFELRLVMELGLLPDLNSRQLSPVVQQWATQVLQLEDAVSLPDCTADARDLDRLDAFLHGHWIHQIGRRPKRPPLT